VRVPIEQVEIVVGGMAQEQTTVGGKLSACGMSSINVGKSTWIALRVRGSLRGQPGDIAAHSSAVQILVGDAPLFSEPDAYAVLQQIEGAIAYVDTLAPRPEVQRFLQLRATLEAAHNRLHNRMHKQGIDHLHSPVLDHERVH
jgi:hypothetical protein